MADKSTIKALSDSNLASGKTGGILASEHREVNNAFLDGEATLGTGATVLFDSPLGRIYNSATPSNAATITLDNTGALVGGVSCFYNDGSVEPAVTPSPLVQGGTWEAGQVNAYFFMWDGTNFLQNILTAPPIPQLNKPTFTLSSGQTALSIDYASVVLDGNSTGSTMELSSDTVTWFAVTSGEYTHGDVSGAISSINGNALISGTTYTVRIRSSAPNYQDSDYASESAQASAQPTLSTPTVALTPISTTELSYTISNEDASATGGVFEQSTDQSTWTPVSGYSFATKTGNITGLAKAQRLYVRLKNTASGYTDSAYGTDNEVTYIFANTHSMVTDGLQEGIKITQQNILPTNGGNNDLPFSVEVIFKKTNALDNSYLYQISGDIQESLVSAATDSGDRLFFGLLSSPGNYIRRSYPTPLNNGQWYHAVCTYDGSENASGLKIYLDGTLLTTNDISLGTYLGLPNQTAELQIPRDSATFQTDATINWARHYDKELTASEVTTLYNSGTIPVNLNGNALFSNILLEVPFNNNADTFIGTDGVIYGSPTFNTDLP